MDGKDNLGTHCRTIIGNFTDWLHNFSLNHWIPKNCCYRGYHASMEVIVGAQNESGGSCINFVLKWNKIIRKRLPIREGFKKKEKKSREFSLTGGAGSPPFPTYFIFDFLKQLVNWCFLIVVFCLLSEVKITLKKPKISWKIHNFKAFLPLFSWAKLSQIAWKNSPNLTLGCRKKS